MKELVEKVAELYAALIKQPELVHVRLLWKSKKL